MLGLPHVITNKGKKTNDIWGYVLRFSVVRVLIYTLIATIFLTFQDAFPEPTQNALDTFMPYRPIGVIATTGQILRSIILALVLYPFYDTIIRGRHGLSVLFGALWGIVLVGSVEPLPGSIEGMIYTEIPLNTHLIVLASAAIEVLIFSWLFLRWERQSNIKTVYWSKGGDNRE